jgi:hypothetical protein
MDFRGLDADSVRLSCKCASIFHAAGKTFPSRRPVLAIGMAGDGGVWRGDGWGVERQ